MFVAVQYIMYWRARKLRLRVYSLIKCTVIVEWFCVHTVQCCGNVQHVFRNIGLHCIEYTCTAGFSEHRYKQSEITPGSYQLAGAWSLLLKWVWAQKARIAAWMAAFPIWNSAGEISVYLCKGL